MIGRLFVVTSILLGSMLACALVFFLFSVFEISNAKRVFISSRHVPLVLVKVLRVHTFCLGLLHILASCFRMGVFLRARERF